MSYSDYGAYCWRDGIRYKAGEDASVAGYVAPQERPLQEATGFKLDVLTGAAAHVGKNYGDSEKYSHDEWVFEHAHHLILGEKDKILLVDHKGCDSYVIGKGKLIRDIDLQINYKTGEECHFRRCPHYHSWKGRKYGCDYAISNMENEHFNGRLYYLQTPDHLYYGVSGYGIGDGHFWLGKDRKVKQTYKDFFDLQLGNWFGSSEPLPKMSNWGLVWPKVSDWKLMVEYWAKDHVHYQIFKRK